MDVMDVDSMQEAVTRLPFREGEIVTRGPHVTRGYLGAPVATAAAFITGGWLCTGDIGYFDQCGSLWLSGRLKDVIKSGGENVHAAEVEAALRSLPGVVDAAVVAVPHQRLGEAVAALLHSDGGVASYACNLASASQVPHQADDHQGRVLLGPTELVHIQKGCRHCGLSAFKVPRVVAIASSPLPRTALGKVRKEEVKIILKSLLQQQSKL
jgi:o-succinylbenzoate---CoA ligase